MTLRDGHRVGFVAVTGQILMAIHNLGTMHNQTDTI